MKKILVLTAIIIVSSTQAISAEYKIRPGDTIGVIAQKLGQKPECLLYANGIEADMIVAGESLFYPDAEDIERAKKFAWTQAFPDRALEGAEENYFLKLYEFLETGKIKCSEDEEGAPPLEILALADAERAE